MKNSIKNDVLNFFKEEFELEYLNIELYTKSVDGRDGHICYENEEKIKEEIGFKIKYEDENNYRIFFVLSSRYIYTRPKVNNFLKEFVKIERFKEIEKHKNFESYRNFLFEMSINNGNLITVHKICTNGIIDSSYNVYIDFYVKEIYDTNFVSRLNEVNISLLINKNKIYFKNDFIKRLNKLSKTEYIDDINSKLFEKEDLYELDNSNESIEKLLDILYKNYFYYMMVVTKSNIFGLSINKFFETNYEDLINILNSKKVLEKVINY